VPYFHVVFTLPQQIAAIAHSNKGLVYIRTLLPSIIKYCSASLRPPPLIGSPNASASIRRNCTAKTKRISGCAEMALQFERVRAI
jgi:hypothetical protein